MYIRKQLVVVGTVVPRLHVVQAAALVAGLRRHDVHPE